MHWFGMSCGGGHGHGQPRQDEPASSGPDTKKAVAQSGRGCH